MKPLKEILIDNWIKACPEYKRENAEEILSEDSDAGILTRACVEAMEQAVELALQEAADRFEALLEGAESDLYRTWVNTDWIVRQEEVSRVRNSITNTAVE